VARLTPVNLSEAGRLSKAIDVFSLLEQLALLRLTFRGIENLSRMLQNLVNLMALFRGRMMEHCYGVTRFLSNHSPIGSRRDEKSRSR
jgi:hypothetical protein